MKQTYMRKAIAMIELIFAIVIMGIIMMSAPMLISTASKSGYIALQQESIAAVSSEIGMILTHHWDESNTNPDIPATILVTSASGDSDLALEALLPDGSNAGVRAGTSIFSKRSFISASGGRLNPTVPASLGVTDAGDINNDDIDDFIAIDTTALYDEEGTTTSEGDYIDKGIQLTTNVYYIEDSPSPGSYAGAGNSITLDFDQTQMTGSTNIKLVEVTLDTNATDAEMQKSIVLRAFTCNIGIYELEARTF